MDNSEIDEPFGIISTNYYHLPDENPEIEFYTEKAGISNLGHISSGYGGSWNTDTEWDEFDQIFTEYSPEGELTEIRRPRKLAGHYLPRKLYKNLDFLSKEAGRLGETENYVIMLGAEQLQLGVEGKDLDILGYYLEQTLETENLEKILEEAETHLENDLGF